MKTRMDKYYDEDGTHLSRASKNADLYKEVNTTELEDFNLNSNVSVLGDNASNIEIDKIQEILNKKYHEEPKQKINIPANQELESLDLNETREYDINAILDKAKETKEVDYEVERLKKLRNTQYDILNNLDLTPKKEMDEEVTTEQAKLMDLINTITSKEMANKIEKELNESDAEELDPLDLFTDLKGDNEDTMMMGVIKEEELEKTKENNKMPVITKEFDLKKLDEKISSTPKEPIKEVKQEPVKEEKISQTAEMQNSFYNTSTNSMQFSQSDFDDFNDLKDDMKVAKIIIKVLIVLIIIAFLVGCFFLVNSIFDLGII